MGDFKKFGGYGGNRENRGGSRFEHAGGPRKSFGGKSGFKSGSANYNDRPMYKATCSECSKMCEVPFRPTGEKPVLCNNCFGDKKEAQSKKQVFMPTEQSARPDRKVDELRVMVDGLHAKLDRVVDLIKNISKSVAISEAPALQVETKISPAKEESLDEKNSTIIKKKVSKKAPAKKK